LKKAQTRNESQNFDIEIGRLLINLTPNITILQRRELVGQKRAPFILPVILELLCAKLGYFSFKILRDINPLTPNDLQRRRAVNPLKIKISSKNMREKPTNTPIINSVY
jgi:hypothetical protein